MNNFTPKNEIVMFKGKSSFVVHEASYAGHGACFILVESEFGEQWEVLPFSEGSYLDRLFS